MFTKPNGYGCLNLSCVKYVVKNRFSNMNLVKRVYTVYGGRSQLGKCQGMTWKRFIPKGSSYFNVFRKAVFSKDISKSIFLLYESFGN